MQLLASAMLLSACGGSSAGTSDTTANAGERAQTEAPKAEGGGSTGEKIVTIAQSGDWDTFMVMNTTNAGADNVNELMFDRLMTINTDGTFEPRLANSWETNEARTRLHIT